LTGHFRELRSRVVWALAFFLISFVIGLYAAPYMRSAIMAPLLAVARQPTMIYTGITDGLSVEFSLAALFALLTTIPFALLQLWKYAAPALKKNEVKIVLPLLIISPLLFMAGAAFAYFALLPMMFEFFLDFGAPDVAMMPSMKSYLSLTVDLLKAFGLAFQLPLVLVLLNRAGLVERKKFFAAGRYIIVGIFALAALLTPPDVVSQIALAAPLTLMFFLSFLFMV